MRVKVESYLEKGRQRWAYALVAGRQDYAMSVGSGYASAAAAAAAQAAGDTLIASLAIRALAKKAVGRGAR